ncbi:MAG: hypothetical protein Q8M29_09985 [Bacteroidota bacterium]|nr:hypothetical protein [Bacteroidota bacterium]
MKRSSVFLIGAIVCAVVFSSCDALKKMQTSGSDDVYLDPKKDRSAFYKADEPKVAVVEEKTMTPVPEMDPNNPYYKDPTYSPDDYYDNQYASRLKRFHNPTYGLGYYDSYYTNSYFYNQNPYQYGVSIYNGYNFWGPSYNNYMYVPNYNWGGWYGYGSNFGYNSYCGSGWGWNSPYYGYNSPYYSNWYNPYGYNNNYYGYNSWNNPYNNYYGNNYGYNNAYDYNSNVYYGPRVSHSGSNSRQVINPGMGLVQKTASPNTNSEPKTAVAGPTDIKRFEHITVPKETYTKNPLGESTPRTLHSNENVIGSPQPKTVTPVKGKDGSQPVKSEGNLNGGNQPKPKKGSYNNQPISIDNSNSSPGNNGTSSPKKNDWFKSEPIKSNSGSGSPGYSSPKSNSSGGSSKPSGGLKPR